MNDTIIFRMEVKRCYGGFVTASNFMNKMTEGEALCEEELRGITSCKITEEELKKGREGVKGSPAEVHNKEVLYKIRNNPSRFKAIRKPEKLQEGVKGYELLYCFLIDEQELHDIVELQYYYLMKQYYSAFKVTALLTGSNEFYYKASHYFMDVICLDEDSVDNGLYDSIYFEQDHYLLRLQKSNLEKIGLKNFVPLQLISKETLANLQRKNREILGGQDLAFYLLKQKEIGEDGVSPVMRGCLKLLERSHRVFKSIEINKLVKEMMDGSFLSFILFSYSFYGVLEVGKGAVSDEITEWVLNFYRQIKECTICCQQLIENIVMHSESRTGVLTIRFHSRYSEYLSHRYGDEMRDVPYLEILITDYAGKCSFGNLAENFKHHISDAQKKDNFRNLQPVDFLIREGGTDERFQEVNHAFAEYYSDADNIGKNFGLRIFSRVIHKNQGIFAFYSHGSHQIREGESWNFNENSTKNRFAQCMPGTAYSLLFPLEKQKMQLNRAKVGIDENMWLEQNISSYMRQFSCADKVFPVIRLLYNSQKEKEESIRKIADCLRNGGLEEGDGHKVFYLSAKHAGAELAEYLCKAVLIAGYRCNIPDYVFYNCSKEFVENFQQCMNTYYSLGTMGYVYEDSRFTIALFTENPVEETIIIPGSLDGTIIANKMCGFAGGGITGVEWLASEASDNRPKEPVDVMVPPYDILYEVDMDGQKRTIFEHYALQVLETDIQERAFGCRISDTHMRLGSTIHINCFYEAELLFSNRLFISRFTYLLVKDIVGSEAFKCADHITLYSYALYSELLIFETMSILGNLYPEKDFDYAILERESDHRAYSHTDRIRYSKNFENGSGSKEESTRIRGEYFKNRKIICIVPINSTLKTHEKLIDLFCKDNSGFKAENIILNYAIVLVGSKHANKYWTIDENKRVFEDIKLQIKPVPRYFVAVKVDYQEALGCEMCFPKNPLAEIPLIEVNAASTIPNQALGLYRDKKGKKVDYQWILSEEKQLRALKSSLIYSHIQRGENHFSLYFKTDQMFIENKEEIKVWLQEIADQINIDEKAYHILVCPAHFSNAGFLEYINKIIFHEAAITIRTDVDKEYRCNMETKYSSIQAFLEMLSAKGPQKYKVKTYYIDDSIITGRTFYRTKSLIASVTGLYTKQHPNVEVTVFDKIFVLLDRNSSQTRMQYLEKKKEGILLVERLKKDFFAYRTLNISSLRNHGDSCVICQLERQAHILYQASATQFMAAHWKDEKKQFEIKYLVDKQEEEQIGTRKDANGNVIHQSKKDPDRPFRRMACMHIAAIALSEDSHQNRKSQALRRILELLLEDYKYRREDSQTEAFEYFLSYLKVISRPFLVFTKAVHEAVFDSLLVFSEYMIGSSSIDTIIKHLGQEKPYISESKALFRQTKKVVFDDLQTEKQKKDLLLVLMKQTTELKGNYFIRPENIRRLAMCISGFDATFQKDMYKRYLWMVKKLIGVSSDTSKSAWLSSMFCDDSVKKDKLGLPDEVYILFVLENTRAYLDGLERLCDDLVFSEPASELLGGNTDVGKMRGIGLVEEFRSKIGPELRKFQYRDFKEVLENYQWMEGEELTEEGSVSLAAGIELLKYAKEAKDNNALNGGDEKNWEQCYRMVCLMGWILQARSVKLVLELPLECDIWETEVGEAYNRLVNTCAQEDKKKELLLKNEEKREYLSFADSGKTTYGADRLSADVVKALKDYRKTEFEYNNGIQIDPNGRYIIWEIRQGEPHPVFVYIEFEQKDRQQILQLFRNIVCMYFYFNEYIFNRKKSGHLYELMLAERESLVYNNTKLESHTGSAVKTRQYEDILCDSQLKEQYYRSYVLTLLADLQVSDVYRPSLRRSYYGRMLNLKGSGWDITALKLNDVTTFYIAGTGTFNYIKLRVVLNQTLFDSDSVIGAEDFLIGYNIADGIRETFLMIFALIMNAAGPDRAVADKKTKEIFGGNTEFVEEVTVYITKTREGNLRITNRCRNSMSQEKIEEINRSLDYPPGKMDGVSLWSMSRYIKGIISVILRHCLEMLEQKLTVVKQEGCIRELERQKLIIEDLLSERFWVRVGMEVLEGSKYFYTEIPVLSKKYEIYKEFF